MKGEHMKRSIQSQSVLNPFINMDAIAFAADSFFNLWNIAEKGDAPILSLHQCFKFCLKIKQLFLRCFQSKLNRNIISCYMKEKMWKGLFQRKSVLIVFKSVNHSITTWYRDVN